MGANSPFLLFGIIGVFLLTACGGGSYTNNNPSPMPQPQSAAHVNLSVTDAPPAGVAVLSFEVSITGATKGDDVLFGPGPDELLER